MSKLDYKDGDYYTRRTAIQQNTYEHALKMYKAGVNEDEIRGAIHRVVEDSILGAWRTWVEQDVVGGSVHE